MQTTENAQPIDASEKTGCMWTEHGARGLVQHGNHNLALQAVSSECDLFVTSNDEIDGLLDFFDEMAAAPPSH